MTDHSNDKSPTYSRRRLLLGVLVVLILSSVVALAIDTDDAVINATLFYATNIAPRGYDSVRSEDTDALSRGDVMTYKVTLYRGTDYAIFACGEDAIGDLDVYLYDENDNLIDEDQLRDRCPWVFVTPRWTGTFYIQIKNYSGPRGAYHMAVAF